MTLTYKDSNHSYRLDGKPVMGVTSIIGKGLPKPALTYWAAKMVAEFVAEHPEDVERLREMGTGPMVAALKATPWQKRDDAAVRGTDVHTLAEQIAHGEAVDVPEHLLDAVQGYTRWLDEWQPEVIWTERPVASRKWHYAGKPDIICRIDGQVWLLDWKSSRGVFGDYACQVAAYGHAEFSVADDGTEEPMPVIERYGVVHIEPNETRMYEVSDPEAAFKDFLHISWIAKAEQRIKGYLGEPLERTPEIEVA